MMTVKIIPNDRSNLPGKLADAELHFTDGVLDGLKLIGFGVWERRSGPGRNVTFPARSYSVNGERRSFALLRPASEAGAEARLRDLILQAYEDYQQRDAEPEPEPGSGDFQPHTTTQPAQPLTPDKARTIGRTIDEQQAAASQTTTAPANDPALAAPFDADAVARELWRKMSENERSGVAYGIVPAGVMSRCQMLDRKQQHAVTVALMKFPTVGPVTPTPTGVNQPSFF